ncbi:MAG: hypothetical protein QOJ40_2376 [Verrucomicrobiota bacterium]
MILASLARSVETPLTRNVLALRVVKLRFQIAGGTGSDLGVVNAPFTVSLDGLEVASGQTDANGELSLLIAPGETLQVRVLDTIYNVDFAPAMEALTTLHGQQKRLEIVGYLTGHLLTPLANAVPDDAVDGPRTRQAALNLQTDQNLVIDADIGTNTRNALRTAAGA